MGENTQIEWAHHTFNPWIGCTKVSCGCANCYAETLDRNRFSKTLAGGSKEAPVLHWGKGAPRHRTSEANWRQPLKWNRETWFCEECGSWSEIPVSELSSMISGSVSCPACNRGRAIQKRPRVFCASLADWIDDEVPIEWLAELLALIHANPNLDWLLLTKRPENFAMRVMHAAMYMAGYRDGQTSDNPTRPAMDGWEMAHEWIVRKNPPSNVWLGTTTENQEMADKRIPELLKIPATVRFLSIEPMLGQINLSGWMEVNRIMAGYNDKSHAIDWVICGGESGHGARPMHPDWARSLRDQCKVAGVQFFFKQWGEHAPYWKGLGGWINYDFDPDYPRMVLAGKCHHGEKLIDGKLPEHMLKVGKKSAGRILDGVEWNEVPMIGGAA